MSWATSQKRYAKSAKGKAARKRYLESPKGKDMREKYLAKLKENRSL